MLSGFETRRDDVPESLIDENAFEFPEDPPEFVKRTEYDELAEEALKKEDDFYSYDSYDSYDPSYEYDICVDETSCVELGQCSEEGLFG